MKIVPYETLLSDVVGIQPHIAWLLANVPDVIPNRNYVTRSKVTAFLEDLQLKYAQLQEKILNLEADAIEMEDGAVFVALPAETDDDLSFAEDALRTALAEVIVRRGEEELKAEARRDKNLRFCDLYGGSGSLHIQEALDRARVALAEAGAFEAVKAATVEKIKLVDDNGTNCVDCSDYLDCEPWDEVPDIDLDGQPLN